MTPQEEKGFEQWLLHNSQNGQDSGSLKKIWELAGSYREQYQPDVEKGLHRFNARLRAENESNAKVVRLNSIKKVLRIAAIFVVLIGAGLLIRNTMSRSESLETIATETGGQKILMLDDGSQITLNESSKLLFPHVFSKTERRVELNGEAFFEVAKDPDKPFVVDAEVVEIQVLGTSFNVRAYDRENTVEVFVKTGKVAVKVKGSADQYLLTPGQNLVFEKETKQFKQFNSDSDNPLAWKNGTLFFKEKKFKDIFDEIKRQFGVEITVENQRLLECRHTLTVEKKHLEEAFDGLEISCPVRFEKIASKKYSVSGNCCQ